MLCSILLVDILRMVLYQLKQKRCQKTNINKTLLVKDTSFATISTQYADQWQRYIINGIMLQIFFKRYSSLLAETAHGVNLLISNVMYKFEINIYMI